MKAGRGNSATRFHTHGTMYMYIHFCTCNRFLSGNYIDWGGGVNMVERQAKYELMTISNLVNTPAESSFVHFCKLSGAGFPLPR